MPSSYIDWTLRVALQISNIHFALSHPSKVREIYLTINSEVERLVTELFTQSCDCRDEIIRTQKKIIDDQQRIIKACAVLLKCEPEEIGPRYERKLQRNHERHQHKLQYWRSYYARRKQTLEMQTEQAG